jgi:hypothetical protein
MIDLASETSLNFDLVEMLASDLGEIGDLAAEMVDPENVETARAAARAWSPRRLAHSLATEMLAG